MVAANVLSEVVEIQRAMQVTAEFFCQEADEVNEDMSDHVANYTANTNIQMEVFKVLQDIKNDMKVMQSKAPSETPNGSKKQGKRRTGSNKTKKYCWTHGLWNHTSQECGVRKEGHQEDATMDNKMGGSEKGCKK